ncbi:MAG: DUF5667 domain-containing protein [Chloroflexota bacterium]
MNEETRFAALDECRRRVAGGESLAVCLVDYPVAEREELAGLLATEARLGQLRHDPSPAFQARLEEGLLARVDATRASTGALRRGWSFRPLRLASAWRALAVALVVLLIGAGSGVGIVAASDDTLPDSPLYHVKAAKESVELALATSPEAKVDVNAIHIAARGRELVVAIRRAKPQPVIDVLARRVAVSVDDMVNQALALRGQGRPLPARRAAVALRVMEREVERLANGASPAVRATLFRLRTQMENEGLRLDPTPTL